MFFPSFYKIPCSLILIILIISKSYHSYVQVDHKDYISYRNKLTCSDNIRLHAVPHITKLLAIANEMESEIVANPGYLTALTPSKPRRNPGRSANEGLAGYLGWQEDWTCQSARSRYLEQRPHCRTKSFTPTSIYERKNTMYLKSRKLQSKQDGDSYSLLTSRGSIVMGKWILCKKSDTRECTWIKRLSR